MMTGDGNDLVDVTWRTFRQRDTNDVEYIEVLRFCTALLCKIRKLHNLANLNVIMYYKMV